MGEAGYWMSAINSNPMLCRTSKTRASFKRNELSLISKKSSSSRGRRPLVSISPSDGKWHGQWTSDYTFSLHDLRLQDVAEDADRKSLVSITLSIQKHAGFGLSVDGRIITSLTRKCSNCSSPYCKEIDTNFTAWVLPSNRCNSSNQLPEIGEEDPSVIYVKPGHEADLDSLIQDTLRLTTSVKNTCSASCEKSEHKLQYICQQKAATTDGRWSRLLEIRSAYP